VISRFHSRDPSVKENVVADTSSFVAMNPTHCAWSDFVIHYPHPLVVLRGDRVQVGKRDSTWAEWLWVTESSGSSAWMHESLLRIAGGEGEVLEDFSAAEISVLKDERVESLRVLGGWHWCRKVNGDLGWIPDYNLRLIQE
jgi:hypothetical protein